MKLSCLRNLLYFTSTQIFNFSSGDCFYENRLLDCHRNFLFNDVRRHRRRDFSIRRICQNARRPWLSGAHRLRPARHKILRRDCDSHALLKDSNRMGIRWIFLRLRSRRARHYFSGVPSPVAAIVALVILMTSYALGKKVYD